MFSNDHSGVVYLWPVWAGFIGMKSDGKAFCGGKGTVNTEGIILEAR